ncbi:MAG: hypothetical protein KJ977_05450 [Candidatus Omnitrophica bacterium]|nr:hypothetical protein [Candidatus Omnitrophota bacterium]
MAELNLSELRDGIISKFRPGLRNQVSKTSLLMERMYYGRGDKARGAERYRGGEENYKMLQYAYKPSVRTDGRTAVVVPTEFQAEMPMKVSYGTRVGNVLLFDSDKSANKTGNQIFNLMGTRMEQTTKGLKKDVAEDLWKGDRSNPLAPDYNSLAFDSLTVIVAEGNKYGGIDRTGNNGATPPVSNSWFNGNVKTYSGLAVATDFSLSRIDAMHDKLTDGIEVVPTIQITTSSLWREAAFQLGKLSEYVQIDHELAARNIKHLFLNGSPVISDINCPATQWLHLNEDVTRLFIDPDFDFAIGDWESVTAMDASTPARAGNMVHAKALYIKAMMCLWCEEPRLNGKHVGFTIPA